MRNGVYREFFAFLPRCKMKINEPYMNISSAPRSLGALRPKWTSVWASITRMGRDEVPSVEENKVLSDHDRTHVFDVGGYSQRRMV